MDESKPPISPSEFHLRSASERTSADIDPAPLELAKSAEFAAVQTRSGQTEPSRNDPPDGPFAVYYRNEEEVREGFLVALRAMGFALPDPAEPPVRGAKP